MPIGYGMYPDVDLLSKEGKSIPRPVVTAAAARVRAASGLPMMHAGTQITQAGIPLAPIITAGAAILPKVLPWIGGIATGLGVGGLFGDRESQPGTAMVGPVSLGGPGLPEPSASMIAKEWKIRFDCKEGDFNVQYYQLINGRMVTYNQRTGQYKTWMPKKMVVIGKRLPSHQMLTRLRSYLRKHSDDAVTILKITNSGKLRQYQRVATGYKVQRKYR